MQNTPLAERISIVLCGIRNSGKSSLINNLFGSEISIVSGRAGTTTDPVTKSIEMGRLGPVAVTDTAGFDDNEGELGSLRVERTKSRVDLADVVILVSRGDRPPLTEEVVFLEEMKSRRKNLIIALTFGDRQPDADKAVLGLEFGRVAIDNLTGRGIDELNGAIVQFADRVDRERTPLEGLVEEGNLVVLVAPIDSSAPKGRLILPQVETIREVLDKRCSTLVMQPGQLRAAYDNLKVRPRLVVTDSQAFAEVAALIPEDQTLTSFSILFARKKGDLEYFMEGIGRLDGVEPGSRILVLEACSHHVQHDDIGRVKIPALFRKLVQPDVEFDFFQEIPPEEELEKYAFTINCAGCMITRKKMMRRIRILRERGIPGTNYGLFLAWAKGLLPRAIEPFPHEYEMYLRRHSPEKMSSRDRSAQGVS